MSGAGMLATIMGNWTLAVGAIRPKMLLLLRRAKAANGHTTQSRVRASVSYDLCSPSHAAKNYSRQALAQALPIPKPQARVIRGLFYALDLALGILEALSHDYLVADTLKVCDPIPLHWRHYAAGLALHFNP